MSSNNKQRIATIYSGQIGSYRGNDRLDITRKSGDEGLIFAPSWNILWPALKKQKEGILTETDWLEHIEAFTQEMRDSYRHHNRQWNEKILSRETVTLLCYCPDFKQCHRTILARDILPKLGASYGGERQKEKLP